MSEARELMDQVTAAVMGKDIKAVEDCYGPDAVAVTPDQGEIQGRDGIVEWVRQTVEPLSDVRFESIAKYDAGNVAIDEGYFGGTHTGPMPLPSGETLKPTGRQLRVRSCDVATVENGLITAHHFYFDQLQFLDQLGLTPQS
jgi:ketosteroid isomerase-like protein